MSLSFFKKLRREKLTKAETGRIARELRAVMASYPAPAPTRSFWLSRHRLHRFGLSLIAIAVIVVASSGTALAAEQALPGDVLYPIKIKVNERVRERLATTDEAKAQWKTTQIERRLTEAERLAALGRLNERRRVELEVQFKQHFDQLTDRITQMKATGRENNAEKLRVDFTRRLEAHEKKLRNVMRVREPEPEPEPEPERKAPTLTEENATTATPARITAPTNTRREPKNGRPVHTFLRLIESTTNPRSTTGRPNSTTPSTSTSTELSTTTERPAVVTSSSVPLPKILQKRVGKKAKQAVRATTKRKEARND